MNRRLGWMARVAFVAGAGLAACNDRDDAVPTAEEAPGGAASDDSVGASGGTASGGNGDTTSGGSDAPLAGGDVGGQPAHTEGPPFVVSIEPADGATDAEPAGGVRLTFSEPLDAATVNAQSITVSRGGAIIAGDVSLDGEVVTFTPEARLLMASEYSVNVSTAVSDEHGDTLEQQFEAGFATRDGQWQSPLVFVKDGRLVKSGPQEPSMGMDQQGNVLVGWSDIVNPAGPHYVAMARWYRPGSGWEAPVRLTERRNLLEAQYTAQQVAVAVAETGQATAVWVEHPYSGFYDQDPRPLIAAARYSEGEWTPAFFDSAEEDGLYSSVSRGPFAMMRGDQAIFWWSWNDEQAPDPGLRTLNATSWANDEPTRQPTSRLSALPGQRGAIETAASMDRAGNAMLIARNLPTDVDHAEVQCFNFDAATATWEATATPSQGDVPTSGFSSFALDDHGGGMATWHRMGVDPNSVWASRYSAAAGFAAPVRLDRAERRSTVFSMARRQAVATDGEDFWVAWAQNDKVASNLFVTSVYASHYSSAEEAWSEPTRVSDGVSDVQEGSSPLVVADVRGNALIMWSQGGPQAVHLASARWLAGSEAWAEPQVFAPDLQWSSDTLQATAIDNGVVALLAQGIEVDSGFIEPRVYLFQ